MNDLSENASLRSDVLPKITGQAMFSGDVHMAGMAYAKTVRLPVARARVLSIDTSDAESMPGVIRVVTRADITGPNASGRVGNHIFDQPILIGCGETAENAADAVALVAAQSDDEAERAAKLVHVTYQELPAINTWQEAVKAGIAPACSKDMVKGNVEEGFASAAVIVERDFHTQLAEHAYLEPEAGVAYVDDEGRLNIRVGTQAVRQQTSMVCEALGLPYDRVRLFSPYIGGAFGGKHSMTVHVYLGLLATLLKRPVRMVWTREESVCFSCKKQSFDAKVKLGVDKFGCISAYQADINGPTSPYTGKSLGRLSNYVNFMLGPYRQPNINIHGRMFNTTAMEIGAFRGVAGPDGSFVIETLMDEAAEKLGISPLEIRRRNWFRANDDIPAQFPGALARNYSPKILLNETMEAALKEAGPLPSAPKGHAIGRGIAAAMPSYAAYHSDNQCNTTVLLTLNLDGTYTARVSFPELGQGITAMAKAIISRELGVSPDGITLILYDSDRTPIGGEIGFSIATVNAGAAILDACKKMQQEILEAAGRCLERDASALRFDPQKMEFEDCGGEPLLDWEGFKKYCYVRVANPTVTGRVDTKEETRNQYALTSISCVVDVDVDMESGELEILQAIQCHDIGTMLHHASARGQILGATVMGMGTTVMEEFITDKGIARTPSLAEYLIPTSMDIPLVNKALFIEGNAADVGPYGAKAIGEHGMYAVNAAIANAIANATGAHISSEPITPEKILRALGKI